jgi:hypothetical protein
MNVFCEVKTLHPKTATKDPTRGLLTLLILCFSKLVLFQEIPQSTGHYFLLVVICADEHREYFFKLIACCYSDADFCETVKQALVSAGNCALKAQLCKAV